MAILNLTTHKATQDQINDGVINLSGDYLLALQDALIFETLPGEGEINDRAKYIAALAADCASAEDRGDLKGFALKAMIGGAPFFMSALERALKDVGIQPIYSFSVRESTEKMVDGKTVKTNVFKHIGFVGEKK